MSYWPKQVIRPNTDSRIREIDSTSQWKKLHNYIEGGRGFGEGKNLWPSLQLAIGEKAVNMNTDANRWVDVVVRFWGNSLMSTLIFSKVRSHIESPCRADTDLLIYNER